MEKSRIEIATINQTQISVDVSLLNKSDDLFFNATEMSKPFGKLPTQWLRLPETQSYIDALLNVGLSHIKKTEDLIKTRRGRRQGGTWLHRDLGISFARWLSPLFAVRLDLWAKERLRKESEYRITRLAAKTGFLPMARAIADSHDEPKPYHFSNENNLLYRIVLGMNAKKYKQLQGVKNIRDNLTPEELKKLNDLQTIDTGLIKMGLAYEVRKQLLSSHNDGVSASLFIQPDFINQWQPSTSDQKSKCLDSVSN